MLCPLLRIELVFSAALFSAALFLGSRFVSSQLLRGREGKRFK